MNARLIMSLVGALAIAAIAVGCGENDDAASGASDATITTSSLDKEAYVKEASEACDKRRKRLLPEIILYLEKRKLGEISPKNFPIITKDVMLPAFEDEVAAVRELGAPEGDEDEIEDILAAQEAAIAKVKNLKDPKNFQEIERYFTKATDGLEAYGFTACINSGR